MKSHVQHLMIIGVAMLALLLLAWATVPAPTVQAQAGLPPRDTPTPTSPDKDQGKKEKPAGAYIELQTPSGSWGVVQWQDSSGGWHDVEGWQGALPASSRWWVHPKDFGSGPLRWVVLASQDGPVIGVSVPFSLPKAANQTIQVTVQ
jgi:hypothetical protein